MLKGYKKKKKSLTSVYIFETRNAQTLLKKFNFNQSGYKHT